MSAPGRIGELSDQAFADSMRAIKEGKRRLRWSYGTGYYAFTFGESEQAYCVEQGLSMFRESKPDAVIASVLMTDGAESGTKKVVIICNPPLPIN